MKALQSDVISTTEFVRNFSTVLDKVRMSGHGVLITKGSQTVAELVPPPKSGFPIKKLAAFLKSLPQLGGDAEILKNDLNTLRVKAQLPENPWD